MTPARSDDDRPRRSSPGPDRPATLEGITRDGSASDAEEFIGGAGGEAVTDG